MELTISAIKVMAISIKDVAKYYAELPNQDEALDLLQVELSKLGLSADSTPWAKLWRTEVEAPEPPPGKSIAASESVRSPYTGVIDWKNPRCKVSKYFSVADVTQQDRRRIPKDGSVEAKNILMLAKELDRVREAWQNPIGVSSWFRPPAINAQVRGARNSQHINGWAVDVYPLAGGTVADFQRWLDHRWGDALGLGCHRGFCHIDRRGGGGLDKLGSQGKIRWTY